jgi:hypothetical protein
MSLVLVLLLEARRTARSRTSAEYLLRLPMAPILSCCGASGKSGAVQLERARRGDSTIGSTLWPRCANLRAPRLDDAPVSGPPAPWVQHE